MIYAGKEDAGLPALVRFPDPPYGVGRENEPPRSWEKNFGVT